MPGFLWFHVVKDESHPPLPRASEKLAYKPNGDGTYDEHPAAEQMEAIRAALVHMHGEQFWEEKSRVFRRFRRYG